MNISNMAYQLTMKAVSECVAALHLQKARLLKAFSSPWGRCVLQQESVVALHVLCYIFSSGLPPNSVIPLLRSVLQSAGLPAELYSSHSLRRGFATWATRSGWDLKALMQYVGWSDGQSALRYIESIGMFPGQLGIPLTAGALIHPEKLS